MNKLSTIPVYQIFPTSDVYVDDISRISTALSTLFSIFRTVIERYTKSILVICNRKISSVEFPIHMRIKNTTINNLKEISDTFALAIRNSCTLPHSINDSSLSLSQFICKPACQNFISGSLLLSIYCY